MADFYALNGQCWPTVDAGKPCTGWGQCVPNAQCSTDRGGTCDCSEDFYQNRTRCLERNRVGDRCDVASQCVKFAVCQVENGSLCQCDANHVEKNGRCEVPPDDGTTEEGASETGSNIVLIVAIVVGLLLFLLTLTCCLFFLCARRRKKNKKNREDVGSFTDSALSDSTSSSRIPKPYANYAVPFYYPATRSVSSLPFSDMPIYMQDLTLADTEEI
ncbi:hypothetical protein C0Q70_03146 [Pomacea canaliculata]|uniref:EB domain-containing protein n=1 Tax=Pomacea canaliculata TaxID=400727 RepID=A0A2T7PRX0_POMCA|nr:hypothetical protein C0Q70_03146 [Pomacea canaliculata]